MLEHIRSLKRTIDSNLKNQLADIVLAPRCRCHCHTGTSVPRSRYNAPSLQPRAQQRNKTTLTYGNKRQQSKTFTENNVDALNTFEKKRMKVVNERHKR